MMPLWPSIKPSLVPIPSTSSMPMPMTASISSKQPSRRSAVQEADGTIYIPRQALRDAMAATKDFKGLTGVLTCSYRWRLRQPHHWCVRISHWSISTRADLADRVYQDLVKYRCNLTKRGELQPRPFFEFTSLHKNRSRRCFVPCVSASHLRIYLFG